ncbi:fatty acid desaturase [Pseudonocardiaceae bacterium YIM PH 21723]|nr:fatty acid desaturase [Pseudonocardiaceae bacterium YIM PH 21723]
MSTRPCRQECRRQSKRKEPGRNTPLFGEEEGGAGLNGDRGIRVFRVRASSGLRKGKSSSTDYLSSSAILAVVAIVVNLVQLVVVPAFLLPLDLSWGWLLIVFALLTTPFWSLIHEAIHGNLSRDRQWNDSVGRLMSILYGSPFSLLKSGHLLHHRYSRTLREQHELYDPQKTTWFRAAIGYYFQLLGGLYLIEVVSMLLALLPARLIRKLADRLDKPDSLGGLVLYKIAAVRALRQFRVDSLAIALVYAGSLFLYGDHFWMLLAALLVRGFLVSAVDSAYHYDTRLDAPLEAMNLRLPRPLELLVLNFSLHDVHHRNPGLRWFELRNKFVRDGGDYHMNWIPAVARQFSGPISSEEGSRRSRDGAA